MWTAGRLEFLDMDVQLFCRASASSYVTWHDPRGNQITNGHGYTVNNYIISEGYSGVHVAGFNRAFTRGTVP